MRTILSVMLFVCLCAAGAMGQTSGFYVLTGEVKGLSSETNYVYMKNTTLGNRIVDSVPLEKGKFVFKGGLKNPVQVRIYTNKRGAMTAENAFTAYIEPGDLKLTGSYDAATDIFSGDTKLVGSPTHDDFVRFTAKLNQSPNFKAYKEAVQKREMETSRKLYTAFAREKEVQALAFINANPSSFLSLYLLKDDVIGSTGGEQAQKYSHLYKNLDAAVRGSEAGRIGEQRMMRMAMNLPVGAKAVEFNQPDLNGKSVKLSDYKGKYIFVDFWASWCKPCRAENPNVLKAYNSFKAKGFDVLSISLDDDVEKWKKAIAEDQLPWLQVSDLKRPNAAATAYGVLGIPDNFLIDPNGDIVAKGLRGEELESTLRKFFGNSK